MCGIVWIKRVPLILDIYLFFVCFNLISSIVNGSERNKYNDISSKSKMIKECVLVDNCDSHEKKTKKQNVDNTSVSCEMWQNEKRAS